jgi:NAD(P) transhydrogenase
LYSGGRNANSHELECESAGIEIGKYERIVVDNDLRTKSLSSIFAIGDVIGPPGLASSAQQQGRQLAERLFDVNSEHFSHLPAPAANEADDDSALDNEVDPFFAEPETTSANLFGSTSGWSRAMDAPLTLWTLPEIASVGLSAEQARRLYMDDVIEGRAYFKDMARGRLSGGEGFLKVVARCVDRTHHTIIGVHIIGEGANELIQLGSILVHSKATLEQVSRTPFAAVTLSGLYQMACDNALFSPKRTM